MPDADQMAAEFVEQMLATGADLSKVEDFIRRTRYLPGPPAPEAHADGQPGLAAHRAHPAPAAAPQPAGRGRGPAVSADAAPQRTLVRGREPRLARPRSGPAQDAEMEL